MATWPFKHNWTSSYQVTVSFKTDIILSRSGLEQRRGLRREPRRALQTQVTVDTPTAIDFDRFIWSTQASLFNYQEPQVGGSFVAVRFSDSVTVEHVTSGVSQASLTLSVEPGTESFPDPEIDAPFSYKRRLVYPFKVNWRASVNDDIGLPRETIDYDRGRIDVFRPVAFGTRATTHLHLLLDNTLPDFFRYNRGRQGDFWLVSHEIDFQLQETVSRQMFLENGEPLETEDGQPVFIEAPPVDTSVLTVAGDVAAMFNADDVNWGVFLRLASGGRYFRQVVLATYDAGYTTLVLDDDVPDIVQSDTILTLSWLRNGRFASDDLTVSWVTETVAEANVQVQTLPYAPTDNPLDFDETTDYFVDYLGWPDWLDPFDYIVNVQIPRIGGAIILNEWYQDGLEYIVNTQMPRLGA